MFLNCQQKKSWELVSTCYLVLSLSEGKMRCNIQVNKVTSFKFCFPQNPKTSKNARWNTDMGLLIGFVIFSSFLLFVVSSKSDILSEKYVKIVSEFLRIFPDSNFTNLAALLNSGEMDDDLQEIGDVFKSLWSSNPTLKTMKAIFIR